LQTALTYNWHQAARGRLALHGVTPADNDHAPAW
jgi:hypothetical protein